MKYINIKEKDIAKLNTSRLLNIYRINRKYLFQVLAFNGFDTSNGGANINWFVVNDDLWTCKEYNEINFLNIMIKKRLDSENNWNNKYEFTRVQYL